MYIARPSPQCTGAVYCSNESTVVPAGTADTQPCDIWDEKAMTLATIYFPNQEYTRGYCPCESLKCGTLFPELVM